MTKHEVVEHLEWALAALDAVISEIQEALEGARGSHLLELDDADWLYFAIEHADDAKCAIQNRGVFPRLSKEIDCGED